MPKAVPLCYNAGKRFSGKQKFPDNFRHAAVIIIRFGNVVAKLFYPVRSICHNDSCMGSLDHGNVVFRISYGNGICNRNGQKLTQGFNGSAFGDAGCDQFQIEFIRKEKVELIR